MTQSCCATSWLIVACGVRSRAPWWPWDDSGRHGRWVCGFASLPTPSQKGFVNAEFFYNSYVDFGTENLLLAFMDKTAKNHRKEP